MKNVIHIVDGQAVRSQVPNDWIKCTVTGEYRPPEEFRHGEEDRQTRTNCSRTYEMHISEWAHYREVQKQLEPEIKRMEKELLKEIQENSDGIMLEHLIFYLQDYLAANPDARYVGPPIELKPGYKNLYDIDEGYYRPENYWF